MRLVTLVLASTLVAGGCGNGLYRVPHEELVRLVQLPPEQRGRAVLVDEEIGSSDVPAANHVSVGAQIDLGGGGGNWGGPTYRGGGGGVHSGGGMMPKFGGGGGDGKGAAIALLVIAAVALLAIAAVEGARWDGTVEVHPMMPVHLIGQDGGYMVVPLAALDPNMVAWADHGLMRETEGPWHQLDRRPLWRTGWTYGMYGGQATMKSVWGDLGQGTAFTVQVGYFPTQQFGILGSIYFGWRQNREDYTMFESRYTLEAQYLPLTLDRFSFGGYAGFGEAYRIEGSDRFDSGNEGSQVLLGGAMIQFDLHTRIALTARFGLAEAHGEHSTDAMIGMSVY